MNRESLTTAGKQRETWIDALKGFAALTVVSGHIVSGYLEAASFEAQRDILISVFNAVYAFHMPLFFMISGFLFSLAYIDGEGAPRKSRVTLQIGNIAVTYVVWSLLLGSLKMLFSRSVNNAVRLSDLLWIPLKAIGPYWYLYVLFLCYLLTVLLAQKTKLRCIYIVLAVSLACCLLHDRIASMLPEWTAVLFLEYYFFFLVGMYFQRKSKALDWVAKPTCILFHCAVGSGIAICFLSGSGEPKSWSHIGVWGAVMAYALSVSILGMARWLSRKGTSRLLAPIGTYCLEIYLIQTFLITGNRAILPVIGVTSFWASLCISFLTAVILPVFLSAVLKRTGLHGLIFCPLTWFRNRRER